MSSVSISISTRGLEKVLATLDPKIITLANRRAVTRTQVTIGKIIRQELKIRYTMKASRINKDIKRGQKVRRVDTSRDQLRVLILGPRANLAAFAVGRRRVMSRRGRRYAATTRVLRGGKRKIVRGQRGGFLAVGLNNNKLVFERTGRVRAKPRYRGDESLKSVTGPAVAQMVRTFKITDLVRKEGAKRYFTVMQQEIKYRMDKAAARASGGKRRN